MNGVIKYADDLIAGYKKTNKNGSPAYLILSPEEADALRESIRKNEKYPPDQIITTYRDVKIVSDVALLNGKGYLSDELPETGA